MAPGFVERALAAVDAVDADALAAIDMEVRGFVQRALASLDGSAAVLLAELLELYGLLSSRTEAHRARLQVVLAAQQRAHVGITAYRAAPIG